MSYTPDPVVVLRRVAFRVPGQRRDELDGRGLVLDLQPFNGAWFVLVLDDKGGMIACHCDDVTICG